MVNLNRTLALKTNRWYGDKQSPDQAEIKSFQQLCALGRNFRNRICNAETYGAFRDAHNVPQRCAHLLS